MSKVYTKQQVCEIIYNMLMSQRFVDWYEDDFTDHVEGEEDCKKIAEIYKDIEEYIY